MRIVAEHALDLSYSDEKVWARIYEPVLDPDGSTWASAIEISAPLSRRHSVCGASSLQALILAMKVLSIELYAVHGYREKKLGWKGQFGGDLGLPAVDVFLNDAPYQF